MSGSFESVRWNACVHRLDQTSVYTLIQKSFCGMESETMLTPREKTPLPKAQRKVEAATLHHTGRQAEKLQTELFRPLGISLMCWRFEATAWSSHSSDFKIGTLVAAHLGF